jgi:GDP/UDP-N,N'-diacetylbacillosamine 2-epimerase (hydrolysing)
VRRALFDENYREAVARCRNPYGDGRSSARIAEALATIAIDDELLIKDITY